MLTYIARLFAAPTRRKPAPRTRLFVEPLEHRAVPAVFTAASASELIADINAANLTAESDTIVLTPDTTYSLTAVNNRTNGPTGTPVIASGEDLSIVGNGATIERSSVAGTPTFRLFDVAFGASLTLQDLTLQGGLASGYQTVASGGAIFNQGNLTLEGVTIQNNTALGYTDMFFRRAGDAAGGGVYSSGALTMTGCTLQNNWAIGGRGVSAALSIPSGPTTGPDTYLPSSPGGRGYGGALYVAGGTASITDCSFLGNTAQGGDGGNKYGKASGSDGGAGSGGAVFVASGEASLHNTTITANNAIGGLAGTGAKKGQGIGGGLYIDASALVNLDVFTRDHVVNNLASTNKSNIAGSYHLIS